MSRTFGHDGQENKLSTDYDTEALDRLARDAAASALPVFERNGWSYGRSISYGDLLGTTQYLIQQLLIDPEIDYIATGRFKAERDEYGITLSLELGTVWAD